MDFGRIVGSLIANGMSNSSRGRTNSALGGVLGQVLGGGRGGGGLGGLGGLLGGGGSVPGRATTGRFETDTGMGGGLGPTSTQGSGMGSGMGMGGGMGSGLGGLLGGLGNIGTGQAGGIGAVLGGMFMGGRDGAAVGALKGGAIGALAAIALSALRERNQQGTSTPALTDQSTQADVAEAVKDRLGTNDAELDQMTSPETARLILRGMLEAAKADGQVSPDEMKRIMGKLDQDGDVTDDDRRFVLDEIGKPADLDGLVRDIPNKEVGAQVYAAALLAIEVDTEAERRFMSDLASRLQIDDGSAQRIRSLMGVQAG
ncbi:MAG: DUF533 domain-containing protein [Geminicoccaceae bacterium]|nr:DUF533 domain-containing protein [Geminicoccaceae bacterium]